VDYALIGVKEYWLVNYQNEFIEQYLLENEVFVLVEKVQHGTAMFFYLLKSSTWND